MADQLRQQLTLAAYLGAARIACTLPAALADGAGRGMGVVYGRAARKKRRLVASHLRRVGSALGRPELARSRAVDRCFASYGRYWVESFRLPVTAPASLEGGMACEGMEHLRGALEGGRGAILALPHLGGWDVGGAWLASVGVHPVVAVEALEPASLFRWFSAQREARGLTVVAAGPGAAATLAGALRRNQVVGLVSDRALAGRGSTVSIFGAQATLPEGPALLALRTGAPILPAAVYLAGRGRHRAVIRPPLPVPGVGTPRERVSALTRDLAGELEGLIAGAPEQWHLLQPYWDDERTTSGGSPLVGPGASTRPRGASGGSGAEGDHARARRDDEQTERRGRGREVLDRTDRQGHEERTGGWVESVEEPRRGADRPHEPAGEHGRSDRPRRTLPQDPETVDPGSDGLESRGAGNVDDPPRLGRSPEDAAAAWHADLGGGDRAADAAERARPE